MFRRLVILWMILHLVVSSGIPVGAEEINDRSERDSQEENQQVNGTVEQKQEINTGDQSNDIIQEQEVTVDQNQLISDSNVTEDDKRTEVNSIHLEQSVNVHAEQSQTAENIEKVDAEQKQAISIEYSQTLNVKQDDEHGQETLIETDQRQSIKTENHTDFVEQTMKTEIESYQKDEINLNENAANTSQETNIKTNLEHKSKTSDHATINQKQSLEAVAHIANAKEAETKEINIKAIAENGLQIIQEVSHYVIKIFQSIVVNNEDIDTYEEDFIIDHHQQSLQKSQEYRKEFDWGVLSILNNITINTSEDNDLHSALSSIMEVNYFIKHNNSQNENEQREDEAPENPEKENPDENELEIPEDRNPEDNEAMTPGVENPDEDETDHLEDPNPEVDEPVSPGVGNPDEDETDHLEDPNPEVDELEIPGEENSVEDETNHLEDPNPEVDEPIIPGKENPNEDETDHLEDPNPEVDEPIIPGEENPDKEHSMNPEKEAPSESKPPYPIKDKPENKKLEPSLNKRKQKAFIKKPIDFFIDIDGDGVPNHLEISKFKTNPFKADTDGDGLSDWFEITYHSATSFYYSFECMEYDWRDFVQTSEETVQEDKEIRLNPLSSDTDQDGILDHLEDFDGDGIPNIKEQLLETNPYIHNMNGNYVGPTELELKEIINKGQKGC